MEKMYTHIKITDMFYFIIFHISCHMYPYLSPHRFSKTQNSMVGFTLRPQNKPDSTDFIFNFKYIGGLLYVF